MDSPPYFLPKEASFQPQDQPPPPAPQEDSWRVALSVVTREAPVVLTQAISMTSGFSSVTGQDLPGEAKHRTAH